MKIRKITFFLIILFVVTSEFIPINGATAILEVSTEDIYLTAGQENLFTINLKNNGDYKIFEVEAFLSSSIPGISILSDAHKVYSEIGKEKTRTYTPTIYIDQNVELGSYTLSLSIIYRKFGSIQDSSITVPIGLVVSEGYIPKIRFISGQENVKVKSGTENKISFEFDNNHDEELLDLSFSLTSSSTYISIVEGVNFFYEDLSSRKSVTLTPIISILEGTPLGVYNINAIVTYRDTENNRYHQLFSLPINIDRAEAARNTIITLKGMKISPSEIRPGDVFDLSLIIECSSADAFDILASTSFDSMGSISPLSPTTISIGDLNAGETKQVSYNLLAGGDISAGQYPLTSVISYTDSKGFSKTFSETLTILISGLIEFELLDVSPPSIEIGKTAEIEADLLLVGTESVQFVSVEVLEDDVFKQVSGSEEYIGAIDPDSPIPFDLNFRIVDETEPGDYEMIISIQFRDHLNRVHEEIIGLGVSVIEGSEINGSEGIGGLIFWLRRIFGLGP
jgi:hypothetical protein